MKPPPSYSTTGHGAEPPSAKVEVGMADWVAIDVGVELDMPGDEGVGVAGVDDGGAHAARKSAPRSTARMP
jgi:hypothetical protein